MLYLILGPHADGLAVLVLAAASFTDWLDGFLARRWHQTSRLGQMLDPIADRLYIFAVLIGLALREIIPWWLVIILLGREVMIALLIPALKTRGYTSLPVHFLGKAGTFCLLYAFPLVLWGSGEDGALRLAWVLGWAFAIWGTGLYWYAGLLYLGQTLTLLRTMPRRPAAGRAGHVRHLMATPTRAPDARPPAARPTPAWTCSTRSSGSRWIPTTPSSRRDRPGLGSAGSSAPSRWLIGAMFAVAALQTTRSAPELQAERSELISRVTGRRSAIRTDCAAGRPT